MAESHTTRTLSIIKQDTLFGQKQKKSQNKQKQSDGKIRQVPRNGLIHRLIFQTFLNICTQTDKRKCSLQVVGSVKQMGCSNAGQRWVHLYHHQLRAQWKPFSRGSRDEQSTKNNYWEKPEKPVGLRFSALDPRFLLMLIILWRFQKQINQQKNGDFRKFVREPSSLKTRIYYCSTINHIFKSL